MDEIQMASNAVITRNITVDPCAIDAIQGLPLGEAIKLVELEIYMRRTMKEKLRDKLTLLCAEKFDLEECLTELRKRDLCLEALAGMCNTTYCDYVHRLKRKPHVSKKT